MEQWAFQQQAMLFAVAVPAAIWLARSPLDLFVLLMPLVMSMVTELLNTAIECLADEISGERRALLGAAKDCGSAAVMLLLISAGILCSYTIWANLISDS